MRHWTPAPTTKTPSELLTDIESVDGTGSGLDADLLDGISSADFTTLATLQSLSWANEVMNFPANVGMDIDLDAANQWWDKSGTPTTAVTMVDVAGEAGITATWQWTLKTVCDAASEGFYQRYTYADQPRIKSGRKLSAMAAIWVVTAGRTVTMELTTSGSSTVTATATAQAWTICKCENLTLDGNYVDIKFTVDGADTFYVVPLGCNIGERALALPPRKTIYHINNVNVANAVDPGTSWQLVDLTSVTNNLACMADLYGVYENQSADYQGLNIRRYGDTEGRNWILHEVTRTTRATYSRQAPFNKAIILTDGQEFEYIGSGTAAHVEYVYIHQRGYWVWE